MTTPTLDLNTPLTYGPAPESETHVRAWLTKHNKRFTHFVDGGFIPIEQGRDFFPSIDPATGETLAEVAEATNEQVDSAVKAAERAFPSWSALSGFERSRMLYAIARSMAKHERLFSVLESMDNGKPFKQAQGDVQLAIRHFYYFAGIATAFDELFPDRVPGGVIAQIIPWNFPLLMLAWKIAPAIAVGNTVVLKTAELTPLTAMLFAELLSEEVGLPAGVVNIVNGRGKPTGEALVTHPTSWAIEFTGSTEVGRMIRRASAGTNKHLTLELGGKSALIVYEDADLDAAADAAIWSVLGFNQGQVCCAGSRLLPQESIEEALTWKIRYRMDRLRVGHPRDKSIDLGAVISPDQLAKNESLLTLAREQGAVVYQPQGWQTPKAGLYFPPSLCTGVKPAHDLFQHEVFGTVLAVTPFRTPDEAIALSNQSVYGLAASVWTQDVGKALMTAAAVKAGTVWVNDTQRFDAASGFGGYRESGYGREGGLESIYEVTVRKTHRLRGSPSNVPEANPMEMQPENAAGLNPIAIDRTYRFLVDGSLARPDAGGSFTLRGVSGKLLATVSEGSRKDVRNAVEAARGACTAWAARTPHNRAQILYFLAENLAAQTARFIHDLRAQTGCTEQTAHKEVELSVHRLFRCAAMADKFLGTIQPVAASNLLVTASKEPVGVIAIRAPDKCPLLGVVATVGPALAMGNTVVLVAGRNPLSALELIQVVQNSDFPKGVLNILSAREPGELMKTLADHLDVDAAWSFGDRSEIADLEARSIHNMKRTYGESAIDWWKDEVNSQDLFHAATQVKNTWVPYGA